MKLRCADIDSIDLPCTILDQDLCETTGRCTDIKANAIARRKARLHKRVRKFDATTRHVGMGRLSFQYGVASKGC